MCAINRLGRPLNGTRLPLTSRRLTPRPERRATITTDIATCSNAVARSILPARWPPYDAFCSRMRASLLSKSGSKTTGMFSSSVSAVHTILISSSQVRSFVHCRRLHHRHRKFSSSFLHFILFKLTVAWSLWIVSFIYCCSFRKPKKKKALHAVCK